MHEPAPLTERLRTWPGDPLVLIALLAIAAANSLLWAFTVPFNEAPDEAAHFQVARFILDHGRLPIFRPDEIRSEERRVGKGGRARWRAGEDGITSRRAPA